MIVERSSRLRGPVVIFVAVMFVLADASSSAANFCDWTGTVSNLWNNAGNWTNCGGTVPQTGDTVNFQPGGQHGSTQNDIVGLTAQDIDFFGLASGHGAQFSAPLTLGGSGNNVRTPSGNLTLGNISGQAFNVEFSTGSSSDIHVSGVLSGSGTVTVDGAAIVYFEGANTFTGAMTINSGEVYAQTNSALGTAGAGTLVNTDAALVLNGITTAEPITLNPAAFLTVLQGDTVTSGQVSMPSSGVMVFNVASGTTLTMNGGITAVAATTVFKINSGKLTLGGANGQSATTVNAGTLILTGTHPGTMTNASGVFGGTGTIGSLTASGGIVAPGLSPGLLISSGTTTFNSSTTFEAELNGTAAGTQYDQLRSAGVTLGNPTLNVILGFTPPDGTAFTIIDNTSGTPVTGGFNGLAEGGTFASGGKVFRVSYQGGTGNDVVVTALVSVPTMPWPWLLGLGLLLAASGSYLLRRSNVVVVGSSGA